ncbi:MAG: hypothetical protein ABIJ57_11535 [Pseudomonadota bacterium]
MAVKTGFFHRLEWPDTGGVSRQDNRTVEAFAILHDEMMQMHMEQF